MPPPIRVLLLTILALTLPACSYTPYKASPAAARSLVLSGGGFGGGGASIADGNYLVSEIYETNFKSGRNELRHQTKTPLTPAQWQAFWQEADQLHIPKWKHRYLIAEFGGNVTDSPYWSVELRTGEKTFLSEGDAAYPDLSNPRRSTLNNAALQRLCTLFSISTQP